MRILTPVLAAAAALAACSSSVTLPDETPDSPVAAFAKRYTDAICGRRVTCNALADYLADACAKAHTFAAQRQAVAEGRASFDQAAADACIETISSLTCQQLATLPASIPHTFSSCGSVFQGHVAPGEPCHVDEECADGQCASLDEMCPGVCQAKKKPGDPCSTQDCGYSDQACSGDGTCAGIGDLGDPCYTDGFNQCKYGLRCLNSVCAPFAEGAKEGESCIESKCAEGLSCNGNTCIVRTPEGGTPCDLYGCVEGLVCKGFWRASLEDSNAPGGTGTCTKPVDIGGPCMVAQGVLAITGCATGLECVNGKCAMPPTSGPCGASYGCGPGYYCDFYSDECVPQDPDGTECIGGVPGQCAGGGCRAGVCASACAP